MPKPMMGSKPSDSKASKMAQKVKKSLDKATGGASPKKGSPKKVQGAFPKAKGMSPKKASSPKKKASSPKKKSASSPKKQAASSSSSSSSSSSAAGVKKEGGKTGAQAMKKPKKAPTPLEKPDYYLIKSEPLTRFEKGVDMKFSIDDLIAEPNSTAHWDGVRNYLARNYMISMKKGDKAFFYHSNAKPSGIVGIVEVVTAEAYPDHTAFDPKDPHFDPKSKKDEPTWKMVDVKFVRKLKRKSGIISLEELKQDPFLGKSMALFTKARLSVGPVSKKEWDYILTKLDKAEM